MCCAAKPGLTYLDMDRRHLECPVATGACMLAEDPLCHVACTVGALWIMLVPKYLIRIQVCRVEAGSILWTPCCVLAVSEQSLAHCPAGGGVCFPCAWSVPTFSWMCQSMTHMITSRTVLEQNDRCYSLHLSWILMLLLIDDSGESSEGQQKGVSRAGYEKQHRRVERKIKPEM